MIAESPNIVKDGLVLHLDAGNAKSYPGTGTVWYDLSVNQLQFNSSGTQTPWERFAEVYAMNFNGSGYWYCDSGYENVNMGGDYTLEMWYYHETLAVRKTIFEKAGTSYTSYRQEIACTMEAEDYITYYSRNYPTYDSAATSVFTDQAWNMMTIKALTGEYNDAIRRGWNSKNGAAFSESYTSNSTASVVASTDIRVGTGYAGVMTDGAMGIVRVYDRLLSDEEIAQNFEANRSRFGL